MIGIIVNPHARHARDPGLGDRLRRVVREAGAEPYVHIEVTRDLLALRRAVVRFATDRLPLVATCGGDGTTMATLTALVDVYGAAALPRLLLLRGGTVNTIAQNLGIRGRPERLLERVLALVRGPADLRLLPCWPQDLIQVSARHGRQLERPRYGCLFAAAMGARFLETYYAAPRQGLAAAVLLTARTVASTLVPGGGALAQRLFAETEADLWIDGQALPCGRFRLLLAATVPDVGLGMRVTWRAGRIPGRMNVVASRLSISDMARQLPRVRRGEPLTGPPGTHWDRPARSLRARFPRTQPFTLDGDLFRATEVEVTVGPRLWIVGPLA